MSEVETILTMDGCNAEHEQKGKVKKSSETLTMLETTLGHYKYTRFPQSCNLLHYCC